MIAYFQGQSYHYLTESINCLWLQTDLETIRVQYEVTADGLLSPFRIMELSFYHPNYQPWQYSKGFTVANVNEVAAVIEAAMNVVARMKAACVSGVEAQAR